MTTPSKSSDLHDCARDLAGEGAFVFPCRPGAKVPATKNGLKDATTNVAQVDKWWTKNPDYNVAVSCGPTELVVIDLDQGPTAVETVDGHPEVVWHDPDGFGSWARLLDAGPHPWPTTMEVGTPRGGLHLIFLTPDGVHIRNSAGKLGNGIDVRAEGGYVLVPPSVTEHGTYTTQSDSVAPADLPGWLVDLLTVQPAPARPDLATRLDAPAGSYGQAALERELGRVAIAPIGQRNDTVNRAAYNLGQLIAAGALQLEETADALLLAATRAGISEEEAEATIKSGLRAGLRSPRRRVS